MFRALVCLLALPIALLAGDPEIGTVLVLGTAGSGSGAVIDAADAGSLVLTNRHVCPNGDKPIHVRASGKIYPAEWLGADPNCDVAVLHVKVRLPGLLLAKTEPVRGATVRLFGYGGLSKEGKVLGPDGTHYPSIGDGWFVGFTPQPGDSGSPLIDAEDNVVGLARGWRGSDYAGQIVRLDEVRRVVAKYLVVPPGR